VGEGVGFLLDNSVVVLVLGLGSELSLVNDLEELVLETEDRLPVFRHVLRGPNLDPVAL